MLTIYRYAINNADGINYVSMPANAKVISAGISGDTDVEEISIWAEVETNNSSETRLFVVVGTGADLTDIESYTRVPIATVQKKNRYAFHIYEILD